jgi:hypothetical protein
MFQNVVSKLSIIIFLDRAGRDQGNGKGWRRDAKETQRRREQLV